MRSPALAVFWVGMMALAGWFLSPSWASNPKLDALGAQLRHPDVDKRIQALKELARENGLPALACVLVAAHDGDERVRAELERTLSNFRAPDVADWLLETGIHFPDKWVRFYCVHAALQVHGLEAVIPVLQTMDRTYPEVQVLILERLALPHLQRTLTTRAEAMPLLARVLSPGHAPRSWLKAVSLLQATKTPTAAEILVSALEERQDWPPPALVPIVHNTLSRLQGPGIVERMKAALAAARSPAAKMGALASLGASGEDEGIKAVLDFLQAEKDPDLRAAALTAVNASSLAGAPTVLAGLVAGSRGPEALLAASTLVEHPGVVPDEALKPGLESAAADFRLQGILGDHQRFLAATRSPDKESLDAPLEKAESAALRRSLAWLVRNQEEDGHWSTAKHGVHHERHGFAALYPPNVEAYVDVATTGWCLLALLSDRHHHRGGPYSESVRRAVRWLIAHQKPNGMFKAETEPMPPEGGSQDFPLQAQNIWATNHLVATLAILEASGMAGRGRKEVPGGLPADADEKAMDAAGTRAVGAILDRPLEGEYNWFNPKIVNLPRLSLIAAVRFAHAKRAVALSLAERDLSATVNKFTMDSLNKIAESATTVKVPYDRNGNYWFRAYASSAQAIDTAVYLTPKQVGQTPIHQFISQRMDLLHLHPPQWNPFYEIVGPTGHPPATEPGAATATSLYTSLGLMPGAWKDDIVNFEYWFYATNACFIVGESDWFDWRAGAYPVLTANQTRIGPQHGSWEPEGPNERALGRCQSTAWGSLMLSMSKRNLSIHNVMWQRVVPRNAYGPKRTTPPKKDEGKDEGKDGKKGEGMEHPGGKMEHPGEKK